MSKNPSILLVDDEKDLIDIFAEGLEAEGFDVTVAESASEALEILRNGDFDIVISDIIMPGGSGRDLIKEVLKEKLCRLFYFSTGLVDYDEEELLGLGANGIVVKPYRLDTIVKKIQDDLKRS